MKTILGAAAVYLVASAIMWAISYIVDLIPVIAGLAIVAGLIGLAVAFYNHHWSEPNE